MAALRPLLEDASVLKLLLNAKYDGEVLANPANGGIASPRWMT
jgi:DNA polymerase-1